FGAELKILDKPILNEYEKEKSVIIAKYEEDFKSKVDSISKRELYQLQKISSTLPV
ncbi:2094_t:CDS:2, partial [Dentiscutata erythropus]